MNPRNYVLLAIKPFEDAIYKTRWDRRSRKILKGKTGQFTPEMSGQISEVWRPYSKANPNWAKFYYFSNGIFSPYYVPSDIHLARVCRVLNSSSRFSYPLLQDKNYLNLLFADVSKTETIVHSVNSQLLDRNYRPITLRQAYDICLSTDSELVIKPSLDTSEARNVEFMRPSTDGIELLKEKMTSHGTDYVIQKALRQHPGMAALNPDSVNTFRITSLLWNGEVIILGALVRIGIKGVRVDNLAASNGVICSINMEKGTFYRNAYDINGNSCEKLPTGIVFEDYEIPGFFSVIELAKQLHYRLAHFRLIGWDFTVDENANPVLIETNLRFPEVYYHQMGSGPLFGEGALFKEVMDYVFSQENYQWYQLKKY